MLERKYRTKACIQESTEAIRTTSPLYYVLLPPPCRSGTRARCASFSSFPFFQVAGGVSGVFEATRIWREVTAFVPRCFSVTVLCCFTVHIAPALPSVERTRPLYVALPVYQRAHCLVMFYSPFHVVITPGMSSPILLAASL